MVPKLLCFLCLLGAVVHAELPPGFVHLSDIDPTIQQDIRYASIHNFIGRPFVGYVNPTCILTTPAAQALHKAQIILQQKGYSLKVYDCFRPQRTVDSLIEWTKDPSPSADAMRTEFYSTLTRDVLMPDYIARKSGHSRGSTMDLTIVPVPTPVQPSYDPAKQVPCFFPYTQRYHDNSLDMGCGFDCFHTIAWTNSTAISDEEHANRYLLKATMEAVGFDNYGMEWWHYTLHGEPFPSTFFDFPVE